MPAPARTPSVSTSPRANRARARNSSVESSRRDSLFGTGIEQVIPDGRPITRSLAMLKERVSRLGLPGGTGLGDHFQASPREVFSNVGQNRQTEAPRSTKSSHPSVSLQNPRLPRPQSVTKGRSLRSQTSGAEMGDVDMQENGETPRVIHSPSLYSSRVLGAYNWVKEAEEIEKEEVAVVGGHPKPPITRSRLAHTVGPAKPSLSPGSLPVPRSMVAPNTFVGQRDVKSMGLRGRHLGEELETVGEEQGATGTHIMVYVRLRPMSKKEKEAGSRSCVRVVNKRDVYLTEFALETDYLRLKRLRGRHFAFDAAFPDNTAQQEVYNTSTAQLVEGVLQGRNGSVFCYGATGAGKTHTMLGTVQSPGVMVLALKDLFAKMKQRSREGDHVVRLSYLEVYNESVRDLLSPGRPLVLREDSKQGIVAAGLTQYQAYSADEVMTLLQRGNLNRQTEPTRVNETSSRSHAILQVVAEYKVQRDSGMVSRVGKLSLIDLAGSERALATDQRTLRSVEGANINRSLLALSSCINALCEGKKHIPFRNSKLTQLLKDSLGGACQTAMIANISPSNGSFGETQNTLHWADRAKEIRTKVCDAHEELSVPESQEEKAKLLLQMQKENQRLRLQLARLQHKFVTAQHGGSPSSTSGTSAVSPQVVSEQLQSAAVSHPLTSPPFTVSLVPSAQGPSSQGKTPGELHSSLSEREFPERVTAERTIRDLQRTIQLLEMEAERAKREADRREEKLNASIATLHTEHSLELKYKDDLIRKLGQRTMGDEVRSPLSMKPISTPSKRVERKEETSSRGVYTVLGGTPARAAASERVMTAGRSTVTATCEQPRRYVTPKVTRKKASLPPDLPLAGARPVVPLSEARLRSSARVTRSLNSQALPRHSMRSPPLPRFCSPAKLGNPPTGPVDSCPTGSGRKRTFWDITNLSSPSAAPPPRMRTLRRGSTAGATSTPSMLLQPGFARRRQSHD